MHLTAFAGIAYLSENTSGIFAFVFGGYMNEIFNRTCALIGQDGLEKLQKSHIVLCGCGGVGSYALEALVRIGVGKITVIDNDIVTTSNINRQIIALNSTVGLLKTDVAEKRSLDINPNIEFCGKNVFLTSENINEHIPHDANFIIDAIDFVPAKVSLAVFAKNNNIDIIECLGTGNRLDATQFEIKDIYKTSGCPLAKKMRTELKKAGIDSLNVLISNSPTVQPNILLNDGKRTVGSVSFVPSVAGLLCAQYAINKILEN